MFALRFLALIQPDDEAERSALRVLPSMRIVPELEAVASTDLPALTAASIHAEELAA